MGIRVYIAIPLVECGQALVLDNAIEHLQEFLFLLHLEALR